VEHPVVSSPEAKVKHTKELVEWTDSLHAAADAKKPKYSDGRLMEYDSLGDERYGTAERNAERVKPRMSVDAAATAIEALSTRLDQMTKWRDKAQDECEKLRWQWEKDLKELLDANRRLRDYDEQAIRLKDVVDSAGFSADDVHGAVRTMALHYTTAKHRREQKLAADRKRRKK
jgi:ElaB/YqjD/DUF883 family membrane-anchored ribosome-binding protein